MQDQAEIKKSILSNFQPSNRIIQVALITAGHAVGAIELILY
jgi:hypothetical protein